MKGESVTANRDSEHIIQKHIQGCVRNERDSQKALYKHFYSFAMGICLRYANDRLDAAGILNDGFFKAFKNISKYEPAKAFMPWLGRIITNTAIDYYRANLKFADHVDLEDHENISQVSSVYDKLAYNDLLALVQKLSPAYRTVFNLYAIDGYTHEEISETLKISIGTSKSNLFKARQKLQEMLKVTDFKTYEIRSSTVDRNLLQVRLNTNLQ
ncbi:sigma-70 family RNA polymerase sigma factor [Pedobacter frigidisoli]|uniref:Sigma-70 family RNA polymerase sigma factor n=1 Tax=Pedobacter frigidisoli TaxID=2530455 RepID=A0A4R0P8B6_9SPHI|nr:sigma-70 family RNA polymerase sigma factor [Pedobacter frigidisoli]TCD10845.1 sigma-70 family RNA polymerase sigma factor [Pedobacter frigidisoli]